MYVNTLPLKATLVVGRILHHSMLCTSIQIIRSERHGERKVWKKKTMGEKIERGGDNEMCQMDG
jgi:hypothetical protein